MNYEVRMQVTLITMLLLSVLFIMAVNPVSVSAEGQPSPFREKSMLDNVTFLLLDEFEYTF